MRANARMLTRRSPSTSIGTFGREKTTTTTTTTTAVDLNTNANEGNVSAMSAIANAIARAIEGNANAIGNDLGKVDGNRARAGETRKSAENEVYVPSIPMFLCATRMVRDSEYWRSVLIVDERKARTKPRLSWYDATDDSWVPRGWYADGLKADFSYYFGEGK